MARTRLGYSGVGLRMHIACEACLCSPCFEELANGCPVPTCICAPPLWNQTLLLACHRSTPHDRVHQFEKVEQFCITPPDSDESWRMMDEMMGHAAEFYASLGLPYR